MAEKQSAGRGERPRDRWAARAAVLLLALVWAGLGLVVNPPWGARVVLFGPLDELGPFGPAFGPRSWSEVGLPLVPAAVYAATGRRAWGWVFVGALLAFVVLSVEGAVLRGSSELEPLPFDPGGSPDLVQP